eukprot:scaffold177262_cov33-Tisochrysis_lutea.AAC.2
MDGLLQNHLLCRGARKRGSEKWGQVSPAPEGLSAIRCVCTWGWDARDRACEKRARVGKAQGHRSSAESHQQPKHRCKEFNVWIVAAKLPQEPQISHLDAIAPRAKRLVGPADGAHFEGDGKAALRRQLQHYGIEQLSGSGHRWFSRSLRLCWTSWATTPSHWLVPEAGWRGGHEVKGLDRIDPVVQVAQATVNSSSVMQTIRRYSLVKSCAYGAPIARKDRVNTERCA